jgi:hypothetical protein
MSRDSETPFCEVAFARRVRNDKIHNPFHKPTLRWCVSSKKQCVVVFVFVVVRATRQQTLRGRNFFLRGFRSALSKHNSLIKTRGIHFLQLKKQ